MKTKIAFLAVLLTFTVIRMFGQSVPEENYSTSSNMISSSPPTFETTTSGLEIKVWVMTADEHRKMMESNYKEGTMENKDMSMKKEDKKMAMSGNHHIKVEVANAENGETRNDLKAKVEIISPSKKSSWIDLKNMSDHYGSDLSLSEKGPYTFRINLNDKGVSKSTEFKYTVQ
jgi:hypothetical protein